MAHGASVVDYVDDNTDRLTIAESLGARVHTTPKKRHRGQFAAIPGRYDIAVEASSLGVGVATRCAR